VDEQFRGWGQNPVLANLGSVGWHRLLCAIESDGGICQLELFLTEDYEALTK
jgi:hypothetical protein